METPIPAKNRGFSLTASADALLARYQWQALLVVVVVAAGVRMAALADFGSSLYGDFLIWDERVYHHWASALVDDPLKPNTARDFTPLPGYVMAAVYGLFSPDPIYFRHLNILLGVLTCALIFFIGRKISGPMGGLGAGLAAAFYKPFIFFSITILKTSLSVFLFAAVIYIFLCCIKKPSCPKSLFLGIFAGLFTNVRANFLAALPLLPVVMAWQRYRRDGSGRSAVWLIGTYIAGLAISLTPFVMKNYMETGRPALTATGGFNLYLANNPENSCPYYRPAAFAVSNPALQGIQFTIEASRRTGKKLTTDEASRFWIWEVFRLARDEPARFAGKLLQKALALFNRFEPAENFDIGFLSRSVPFFALPFLGVGLMIPLGMAGILRAMARKDPLASFLLLVSFVYAATLVLFFTNIRIRLPLLVVWIPYTVCGTIGAIEDLYRRRTKAVAMFAGTVIVFTALAWIPLPCADDLSGHYNTHAINLMGKGQEDEALAFWKASSEMEKTYSAYADLALAGYYGTHGLPEKAMAQLDKISDHSFAAAHKFERLGDLLLSSDVGGAIEAYEKCLSINTALLRPRKKLVQIVSRNDPKKAGAEIQKLSYIYSFYKMSK